MNTRDLKYKLSPILVAEHFLGTPDRHTSSGNWYKSPFRQERTASFLVSNKGMHDFGSSKHYDIIAFVQELLNVDFKDSLLVLKREFGISDEVENRRVLKYKLDRRAQEAELRKKLLDWYNLTFQRFCCKEHLLKVLEMDFKKSFQQINFNNPKFDWQKERLAKIYEKEIKYEIILEDYLDVRTQDDLEKLYTKYKGAV